MANVELGNKCNWVDVFHPHGLEPNPTAADGVTSTNTCWLDCISQLARTQSHGRTSVLAPQPATPSWRPRACWAGKSERSGAATTGAVLSRPRCLASSCLVNASWHVISWPSSKLGSHRLHKKSITWRMLALISFCLRVKVKLTNGEGALLRTGAEHRRCLHGSRSAGRYRSAWRRQLRPPDGSTTLTSASSLFVV